MLPTEVSVKVSVIIPAYNAQDTLAQTLDSLHAQTHQDWEAIVVDDGSSDETALIAMKFGEKDTRIRVVSQANGGDAAARNTGISLTNSDWILFLDADDWILPQYLERMTGALTADPSLDAVHCGWSRIAPDGTTISQRHRPPSGDLFHAFARFCAFVNPACIVRRSVVEEVGGFDTSLRTCSDWDLWQRIARTGARFGSIQDSLALYRMSPNSISLNSLNTLTCGLRIIEQGYSHDKRVKNPHPDNANGLPRDDIANSKLGLLCWCAGLMLGRGEDAKPLLDAVGDIRDPSLDPLRVAEWIFDSVPLPTCQPPMSWHKIFPKVEEHLNEFLLALENQSLAPSIAHRTCRILERMVLEHSIAHMPLTIGRTHSIRLEVTEPIPDIVPPAPAERLYCLVGLEGTSIGTIELPVCDGLISRYVIADAIASEFARKIIEKFFERTVYPNLRIVRESIGVSVYR
ncbi:MAG: glycosyltransferase, partial [Nitrososphaera sp.]|nr:glycosyltransferase [Nitrososphaera sp.]